MATWIKVPATNSRTRYGGLCPHCGHTGQTNWICCPYCGEKVEKGERVKAHMVKIRIVETGEVFDSILQCAEKKYMNAGSICSVLHGRQKTAYGYHFERVE